MRQANYPLVGEHNVLHWGRSRRGVKEKNFPSFFKASREEKKTKRRGEKRKSPLPSKQNCRVEEGEPSYCIRGEGPVSGGKKGFSYGLIRGKQCHKREGTSRVAKREWYRSAVNTLVLGLYTRKGKRAVTCLSDNGGDATCVERSLFCHGLKSDCGSLGPYYCRKKRITGRGSTRRESQVKRAGGGIDCPIRKKGKREKGKVKHTDQDQCEPSITKRKNSPKGKKGLVGELHKGGEHSFSEWNLCERERQAPAPSMANELEKRAPRGKVMRGPKKAALQ